MRIPFVPALAIVLASLFASARAADRDGPAAPSHGVAFGKIDSRWVDGSGDDEPAATEPANLVLTHLSGVRASVRAEVAPAGKTAAEFASDRIALVTGSAEYQDLRSVTRGVLDRDLPGLSVLQRDGSGVEYRVRQFFVIEHGMLYTLQEVAPSKDAQERDPLFDALWKQIRFDEPSAEVLEATGRRSLAARCGSELDIATTWDEAARRARATNRPILVMMRLYSGLPDSDIAAAGPWMDEDVVQLVRSRFVAFQYRHGMDVPFSAYEVYGLSKTSFGSTALVTTPEGKVIGDTFVAEPFSLCDALRAALPRDFAAKTVEERLAGGDYDGAAKLLASDTSVRGHRLKGDLLRRRRDGAGAIAELETARAEADDAERAAIDVDIAVVMLRMKRVTEAAALLHRVVDGQASPAVTARALWWLGATAAWTGNVTAAAESWKRLTTEYPDDRNAWRAAAQQGGLLFGLGGGDALSWPREELLTSIATPPKKPLARDEWRAAEKGAIDYLVSTQHEDGTWSNPTELESAEGMPDAIGEASDAICGLGLLEHQDDPRAKAALDRLLSGVLERAEKWPKNDGGAFYMDYAAWRHTYVLRFLAACLEKKVGDQARIGKECAELVAHLARVQQPGGGWTYIYTSRMSEGEGAHGDPSLSFVTGAVVAALQDAQERGVKVDAKLLDRALDSIESMEGTNGGYAYMVMPGVKHAEDEAVPGASGRIPLCTHVLVRAGRRKASDMVEALDRFLDHGALLAREQGKSLMHCGPDGQGSHYLYFDYANTALALRAAPDAARGPVRKRLLDWVLAGRVADGSFVDNPLLGRPVATGFALVAFAALAAG